MRVVDAFDDQANVE